MGRAALGGASALWASCLEFCARRSPGGPLSQSARPPAASRTASLVGDGGGGRRAGRLPVVVVVGGAGSEGPETAAGVRG